jgi:hypothetical protein
VLPLANQLGQHTEMGDAADRLEETNLPVLGIGLGAQAMSDQENIALTAGIERWLRTLARLAPSDHPKSGSAGRVH